MQIGSDSLFALLFQYRVDIIDISYLIVRRDIKFADVLLRRQERIDLEDTAVSHFAGTDYVTGQRISDKGAFRRIQIGLSKCNFENVGI